MSASLRLFAAGTVALALCLLAPPLTAASSAKNEPVATSPVETITAADLKKLQDTIKGLHERFEDQGKILQQNSESLGKMAFQVDEYLKASRLKPLEEGLATVVKRLGDLNTAMGSLAEAQAKQATDTEARYREITAAVDSLKGELAKSDEAAAATMVQLRKDIAASYSSAATVPATPDSSTSMMSLFAALAGATFILAVIILLDGRVRRRSQRAAQEHLAAAVAQARDSLLAEIQQRGAASAPGGAGTDSLAEVRTKLQSILDHLKPPAPAVHADDHTTKKFTTPPVSPDELATVRLSPPAGAGISSSACWPAVFLDPASPLAAWRQRIESHLASAEHPALPVFSSFLALRTLCARQPAPSLEEVGGAVITLSQALYAYWETLADLNEDDRARASSDWIQGVKALVAAAAPKLEIREILVGSRFDSDSMQTVREGPGNHLSVAAVLSWATLDRSGERVKILQRARIATN